jgi:hypothetical protein
MMVIIMSRNTADYFVNLCSSQKEPDAKIAIAISKKKSKRQCALAGRLRRTPKCPLEAEQ